MSAVNVITRDIPRNLISHIVAPGPQKLPELQNDVQAARIADVLAASGRRNEMKPNGAPLLDVPSRAPANEDELAALNSGLTMGAAGSNAGAIQNAFANLNRSALLAFDSDVKRAFHDADGKLPDELMDTAPFLAVRQNLVRLIGLVSPDGSMAYPSAEDLAAISGRTSSASFEQKAVGELLSDAPGVQRLLDEASDLSEDELPLRLHTDPRYAYVLMLVAFLMKLAASQREVAASMLVFAEKSIQDMGARMIDSAKQQQLAKVVALAVVVVVSAVAVTAAVGVAAANVKNIGQNQVKANALNRQAAEADHALASGYTTGTRGSGNPLTHAQRNELRAHATEKRNQANELMAAFQVNSARTAVGSQTSQALGQAAVTTGNAAGSGHEITAAELTAQQEKRRGDATTGQQTSQSVTQSAGKADENIAHLFQQAVQAAQERSNTRDDITRHIR